VLDVAHNPSGARFLNVSLQQLTGERRYVAVVGMLADKDAAGVAVALAGRVRAWVCVATAGSRGLSGAALHARLGVDGVVVEDPAEGLRHALSMLRPGEGVLGLGSFNVVEQLRCALADARCGAVMDRHG
jgi:dihydrofolate synthase/folylpolyglutamate synthase